MFTIMISSEIIVNLCIFVVIAIEAHLVSGSANVVKYGEPFPSRFPLESVSRVAFTQYLDVPMLSLKEIKMGFPWLKISDESDVEPSKLRRSAKTKPRYIFHYVPNADSNGSSEIEGDIGSKFRPRVDGIHKLDSEFVKRDKKGRKYRPEVKLIKQPLIVANKEPILRGKNNKRNEEKKETDDNDEWRYEWHQKRDKNGENRTPSIPSTALRENEKNPRDRGERENRLIQYSETQQIPSYLYPKVPSRYMQPPRVEYEDKEFWVKKKRNSIHPTKNAANVGEERLKNHKIVGKKKLKTIDTEKKGDLKNHKLVYDREHDPEERAASSNRNVEKTRNQRAKKKPKNNSAVSQDGERVQFQIHGHEGPQTYIFGYDTGDGDNRHFRIEERLRDGSVRGHYGYYDSNGKLKMVEYKASPMEGYKEEHHRSGKKSEDKDQRR